MLKRAPKTYSFHFKAKDKSSVSTASQGEDKAEEALDEEVVEETVVEEVVLVVRQPHVESAMVAFTTTLLRIAQSPTRIPAGIVTLTRTVQEPT